MKDFGKAFGLVIGMVLLVVALFGCVFGFSFLGAFISGRLANAFGYPEYDVYGGRTGGWEAFTTIGIAMGAVVGFAVVIGFFYAIDQRDK